MYAIHKQLKGKVMGPNKLIAIILIAIGICAFAYQGITVTTRKKDVDLGPVQVSHEQKHNIPIPPVVGGVALAAGIVLLVSYPRRA